MSRVVAYGICVKNLHVENEFIKKTVANHEVKRLGCPEKVIDVVRAEVKKRPGLQGLAESLEAGDRIETYSIETFIAGNHSFACQLYNRIIDKGIDIIVYDFSEEIPRISEFSTLRYGKKDLGENEYEPSYQSRAQLKQCFADRVYGAYSTHRTGNNWSEERWKQQRVFKDIYFAFESYQITLTEALSLLEEYTGFKNKITFYAMCRDFEGGLDYPEEFAKYASHTPEILELPKRVNGIPKLYDKVLDYAESHKDERGWAISINNAFCDLGYKCNYSIFHRWELLFDKKPKPRKPVLLDFEIEKLGRD